MNFSIKQLSRSLRQPISARYAFKRLEKYHYKSRTLEEVVDWAMDFGGSGSTSLIWSHLVSERVISCDLKDMTYQAPLFTRFPPPGSNCRMTLLSGNSHSPEFKARVAQELNGAGADFLFIDGDHTDQGVTADYNDYKEFVRPGGLIGFHDIVEKQPLPINQVHCLWQKLKPLAEVEEYVKDPEQHGFGIGVLHVPQQGAPDLHA